MRLHPRWLRALAVLALVMAGPWARAEDPAAQPVSPDASSEARALLQLLYDISGKYTLTGQHNPPNAHDRNSQFAAGYIGKTPVIFGTDWGHAKAGDSDSYLARPDIVKEAIRQHAMGSIVALCWHAVPPTSSEPTTFRPLPGSDPKMLASVQGKLLDEQFRDVLTPGTALYERWCAQVDVIAGYLKQLQDAHVPVLWRPYHEMNGDWFWWGGRTGQYSTLALYKQMFDRYVHVHHLTNLIWVWNVDRPSQPGREFAKYFPGRDYVDVLALDVYGSDFKQSYYDGLLALAGGKPIALGEVGNPPTPEVFEHQPRWAYYMTWSGMVRNTTRKQYEALKADPRILNLDDPAFWEASHAYRLACGMSPLHFTPQPADFSGLWVLDEDRSDFGPMGAGFAPARLEVVHKQGRLAIKTTRIVESGDDQVSDEVVALDGTETQSQFMGGARTTRAHVSEKADSVQIDATTVFPWAPGGVKMVTTETWTLLDAGRRLSIHRVGTSARGKQDTTLIFDRL